MSQATIQSSALPLTGSLSTPRRAALCVAASLFVAACAHISIPLPFTTVPLTLQPFAVILVGLLLGPVGGFAALALYLVEGAAGLPVFTPAGPVGILRLIGPNGGFLFSYPVVAAIAGGLYRALPLRRSYAAAAIASTAAVAVLYLCGATWFGIALHTSLRATLIGAVLPFLPGEIVKIFAAAGIASALTPKRN